MFSIFSCVGWPSECLLWRSVNSCLLPNYSLDYVFFWVLSLMSSLQILDTNPLSDMSFAKIFSHSVGCLIFAECFLCCAEAFYFDEVPIVHFCFCYPCPGDMLSKQLLRPRSKRFLLAFSSRIWMASCLRFRYFIILSLFLCPV